MVTYAQLINTTWGENTANIIKVDKDTFINTIEKNYYFIERDFAEMATEYKQIVSYCLIVCENDYFITQRTEKQTEKRLHNKYSLGIGGHINQYDLKGENVIIAGMLRELFEEVNIQSAYSYSFQGIINDNSTEVNAVHCGVCFLVALEKKECFIRETEKMYGFWINKTDIGQYYDSLEGWSKILVNSLVED